jgi:hypothetical protein
MMITIPIVKGIIIGYDDLHLSYDGVPMAERVNAAIDAEWGERAKRLLRAQMTLKGVNAATLAEKLNAMGIKETEKNVANKVARGGFTAAFFLQCLKAIGVDTLHLDWRD